MNLSHALYFNRRALLMLLAACVFMLLPEISFAGEATSLPWEGPIEKIRKSLTGPVALGISLIGIVVAGGMLIFGGELGEFARRIIMIVMVLALLVAANNLLTMLYGSAGAMIAQTYAPETAHQTLV